MFCKIQCFFFYVLFSLFPPRDRPVEVTTRVTFSRCYSHAKVLDSASSCEIKKKNSPVSRRGYKRDIYRERQSHAKLDNNGTGVRSQRNYVLNYTTRDLSGGGDELAMKLLRCASRAPISQAKFCLSNWKIENENVVYRTSLEKNKITQTALQNQKQ